MKKFILKKNCVENISKNVRIRGFLNKELKLRINDAVYDSPNNGIDKEVELKFSMKFGILNQDLYKLGRAFHIPMSSSLNQKL